MIVRKHERSFFVEKPGNERPDSKSIQIYFVVQDSFHL